MDIYSYYFECTKDDCVATYFPHQVAEMRGICYCGGSLREMQNDEKPELKHEYAVA